MEQGQRFVEMNGEDSVVDEVQIVQGETIPLELYQEMQDLVTEATNVHYLAVVRSEQSITLLRKWELLSSWLRMRWDHTLVL